jgi:glycogen synthase
MKILIQHNQKAEEIAGVLSFLDEVIPLLKSNGHQIETLSTRQATLADIGAAVARNDLIWLNSNNLKTMLVAKCLGKKVLLTVHYMLYQSIHFDYERLSFLGRLRQEILSIVRLKSSAGYKFATFVRLPGRLLTLWLADIRTTPTAWLAESTSFPLPVHALYFAQQFDRAEPKSVAELAVPPAITFAGRLSRDKGVDLLIEACAQLVQSRIAFQLWVIGEGPDSAYFRELAGQRELQDRVFFLGQLPREEVLSRMEQSCAVVVPSRWQEPAGMVAMEAARVQTVPVVANIAGLGELFAAIGITFAPQSVGELSSTLATLLQDVESARNRGEEAYKIAKEQFSPQKFLDKFESLISEVF